MDERRGNLNNSSTPPVGRAAAVKPKNRFLSVHVEDDFEQLEGSDCLADVAGDERRKVVTEFIADESETILAENNSPDIPFRYSINAYRGCEHGCAYCYARPGHEYLGFNAGIDFETRIVVKHRAAELLRKRLMRKSWQAEPIALSGVTDCYQPAERRFRVTRGCLEVMLEARQPAMIITKNALIERDLDILAPMAERGLVNVFVSVTTLDAELARRMEPRTATPAARLRTIGALAEAGVPVGCDGGAGHTGAERHEDTGHPRARRRGRGATCQFHDPASAAFGRGGVLRLGTARCAQPRRVCARVGSPYA